MEITYSLRSIQISITIGTVHCSGNMFFYCIEHCHMPFWLLGEGSRNRSTICFGAGSSVILTEGLGFTKHVD